MFCRNCGLQVKEGAKFCGSCGMTIVSQQPIISQIYETAPADVVLTKEIIVFQTESYFTDVGLLATKWDNFTVITKNAMFVYCVSGRSAKYIGRTIEDIPFSPELIIPFSGCIIAVEYPFSNPFCYGYAISFVFEEGVAVGKYSSIAYERSAFLGAKNIAYMFDSKAKEGVRGLVLSFSEHKNNVKQPDKAVYETIKSGLKATGGMLYSSEEYQNIIIEYNSTYNCNIDPSGFYWSMPRTHASWKTIISPSKRNEAKREIQLRGFNKTKTIRIFPEDETLFCLDDENKRFTWVNNEGKVMEKVFNYIDLAGFELIENDTQHISSAPNLAGAGYIVGSLLGGDMLGGIAGAVIGKSIEGPQEIYEKSNALAVMLNLNDLDTPTYTFWYIKGGRMIRKDSVEYQMMLQYANELMTHLLYITNNAEKRDNEKNQEGHRQPLGVPLIVDRFRQAENTIGHPDKAQHKRGLGVHKIVGRSAFRQEKEGGRKYREGL